MTAGLLTFQGSAQTTFTGDPFIIKIDTRGNSESISGDTSSTWLEGVYFDREYNSAPANLGVDWENDGVIDTIFFSSSAQSNPFDGYIKHKYASPGTYEIAFYSDVPTRFRISDSKFELISVLQWGDVPLASGGQMFRDAKYLTSVNETNPPVFTPGSKTMQDMFSGCTSFEATSLNNWDVSSATFMHNMFKDAEKFNGDISSWDVSNVQDMSQMLTDAEKFNQDIGNWDVSSVTDMSYMFRGARDFNQDLNNWDVSNVTDMRYMFNFALVFNGDISSWDVSNVTVMEGMFYQNQAFNQDIGNWDVSSVTNMKSMFRSAQVFNQDIGNWDVSSVTTMDGMFWDAGKFNQDIGNWDVSSVTNMQSMFISANSFNQNLNSWNTSSLTNAQSLFYRAKTFNGDISSWDVSNVTNMNSMFAGTEAFNQDISSWDVSSVTDMGGMFNSTAAFNQNISSWDVSSVTSMGGMFQWAQVFNQDISNWNVSSVTNMGDMFSRAAGFNQNIGNWDVSNAESMHGMLDINRMSLANYDSTLIGWASLPAPPQNINIGVQLQTYCHAEEARGKLINQYGWNFEGDSKQCAVPPQAACQDFYVDISPECSPYLPDPEVFNNNSTDENPGQAETFAFSLVEGSATFDLGSHEVSLIVTDVDALSDTCQATLYVVDSMLIPEPYTELDLGYQGPEGSSYSFDACLSKSFFINTGAYLSDGSTSDNMATITRELCGANAFVAVKVKSVEGGYAGVFLRAGTDANAPVAGIFKGSGIVHQTLTRGMSSAPANLTFRIPNNPNKTGWVGILRDGDYLRFFNSNNGQNWSPIGSPAYVPGQCVQAGIAAYGITSMAEVSATLGKIKSGENYAAGLSDGSTGFSIPQPDKRPKATLLPNPATHQVRLQMAAPLSAPADITVTNQLGQPLITQQAAAGDSSVELRLDGLPAGLYYVNLNTGRQVFNLPLIKQ
jgi:surface protein